MHIGAAVAGKDAKQSLDQGPPMNKFKGQNMEWVLTMLVIFRNNSFGAWRDTVAASWQSSSGSAGRKSRWRNSAKISAGTANGNEAS
jgi:hypothetical protein